MSLHWYACISINTCCFEMHHISLETDWWALPNASSIVWIRSAVHEILADKAFTATDVLISQLFVVAFVQIALIWGFPVQLSLWKSVYWLWRYKLNKVCDNIINDNSCLSIIINITNACINLGYWPSHFKMLLSIIIPKSNKTFYNSPKFFCSIILLNTL